MYDLVIVGSGPAGLSAASHALDNGLNYILLQRTDHLSDTIYCYQARKYVMAEPTMIPARGEVPFKAGSRESILDAWTKHCDTKKLNVGYIRAMLSEFTAVITSDIETPGGTG